MKKFYIFIISLLLLNPIIVKAVEVKETTIIGKENIDIGEQFTESIIINFDNLERNYTQKQGILYVKYELMFDSDLLKIVSIESPDWDTIIYEEEEKYYALSIVNTENRLQNNCINSFLNCGDYSATLEFVLNKTNSSSSSIAINNIELALLDITKYNEEYVFEDITIQTKEVTEKHTIIINSISDPLEPIEKVSIIKKITPEEIKEKINTSLKQEPIIESTISNLLSNIQISGYEIDFNKYKNDYTLYISSEDNNLDLEVKTEDELTTYKITGNEELKNNSKITIDVILKDEVINKYIINIKKTINEESEKTTSSQQLNLKDIINKYQKYIKYIIISTGIILLIIIVLLIISKIKDKKIEDMTNRF